MKNSNILKILMAALLLVSLSTPALAACELTSIRSISEQYVSPGDTFRVSISISATGDSGNAPAIQENVPEGWSISEVDYSGAIFKAKSTEWVWAGTLQAGNTRTVIYEVSVPANAEQGTYNFSGTASVFGVDPITIAGENQVIIGQGTTPTADFHAEPTTGNAPLSVNFIDDSTDATSREWDFNNDGIVDSTETNPTYIYDTPGSYTVLLTTTNAAGSNTKIRSNYITVQESGPTADFTTNVTAGVLPTTVQFTDQSTGATSWMWDFNNDGNIDSTLQNPVFTYTQAGIFTVSLTVSNSGGSDTAIKTGLITISQTGPTADFTSNVTTGDAYLTVQFTDLSTGATAWKWDFDNDGTIDCIQQNPVHTYTSPGRYTVSLTASNPAGTDTREKVEYIVVTTPGVDDDLTSVGSICMGVNIVPSIAITVTPECINFGDLAPGQASQAQLISVFNEGAFDTRISAEVTDAARDLYVNGLKLDYEKWNEYSAVVGSGQVKDIDATLCVPGDYVGTGSKKGILVVWAQTTDCSGGC